MKSLAEIFYDAIMADSELTEAVGGRVVSTCFEVPPDELDNTPVPNIIITDDGFQNCHSAKDVVWESDEDVVQATVDIAASSPGEVTTLVGKVRKAIEAYIVRMYQSGQAIPQLQEDYPKSQGIEWDWMKPCYYQKVMYQCIANKIDDDEQESD